PKVEAALAATGPVLGEAAGLASPVLKTVGDKIITGALKAPVSIVNSSSDILGTTLPQKLESIVEAVKKYGVSTPAEAEAVIQSLEGQLVPVARAAGARGGTTDAPQAAQDALTAAMNRLKGVASTPGDRVAALQAQKDRLIAEEGSHSMPGPPVITMQPSKVLGPNGKSVMTPVSTPGDRVQRPSMTPEETLNSARAADTRWDSKTSPAAVDALKVTEVAERNALKKAVPETEPILSEQAKMIVLKKALDREGLRRANQDLMSFGAVPAMVALHNPASPAGIAGIAHMVIKHGGVTPGIMLNKLGDALARNDVQAMAM